MRWIGRVRALLSGAKGLYILVPILLAALLALVLSGQSTSSGAREATGEEKRMEEVLSCVSGAGRVRVLVGEGDAGGVVVVCEGARDVRVALEMRRAVAAFLGVEPEKIEVMPLEGSP